MSQEKEIMFVAVCSICKRPKCDKHPGATQEAGEEASDEQIEEWREEKTAKRQKRLSNARQSINILRKNRIYFEEMDKTSYHYRVGPYDFWPTTGMFMHRKSKEKGRGVFNLIAMLDGQDTRFCDKHMETDCFATVIECNDCAFFLKDN